jgi:drug/metabolite transporter (DMT)-like permease
MKSSVSDFGAIGFALAGFTFWVLGDTSIKLIGQSGLPPYEMVAFLGLFMAMSLGTYALVRGDTRVLRPRHLKRQLARACLDMMGNVCVVIALRHLTLTMFYILIFMAPMLIALLSALLLREGLSWRRGAAIVAGFAGVIIAVHPWGSAPQEDWIGFGACMICVACFSANMVWARVLTRTESPESLAFCSGLVTAAAGLALMLFHAVPLTPGLTAGLFAVKHTSAANVSQYHYTQLLTGTLISFLVWHDKPGFFVLAGGALILASGLYIAVAARSQAPLTEGNG